MPRASGIGRQFWETQLPVDFAQTPVVQNTWYTVAADLSGGRPAKLWKIFVEQTHDEAGAETLELEVTLTPPNRTPTAYLFTFAALASGTQSFACMGFNLAAGDFDPVTTTTERTTHYQIANNHSVPFICRDVSLIRVRQTTAVGTNPVLEVNVQWEKLVNY